MGKIKTYNPKEVTIALGNHIVVGYADDSFITIDPNGDGVQEGRLRRRDRPQHQPR